MKRRTDDLSAYHKKRRAEHTREPFGRGTIVPHGLFVVQKHAATRMHYDLRLELGGVLKSWAVPKRPSYNPEVRRLAVEVEDHPIDYGEFEGAIEPGNYGAGSVILWDRGSWAPTEEPRAALERGKLAFELHGFKLRGRWALVRTRDAKNQWLLLKERDDFAQPDDGEIDEHSILSGLEVTEIGTPGPRQDLVVTAEAFGARRRPLEVSDISCMLAERQVEPFDRDGWLFEPKLDGYRMLAQGGGGSALLRTRNGALVTERFPEIALGLKRLPWSQVIIDGELVIKDEAGLPRFSLLQRRAMLNRPSEIVPAAVAIPATFYAFDLLALAGLDLRGLPLSQRKELLRRVLPPAGPLEWVEFVRQRGVAMYDQAVALGLEGVVGKDQSAPYRGGRSSLWLKSRQELSEDFVVVGHTPRRGAGADLGALVLAWYVEGTLTFVGKVGSGLTAVDGERLAALGSEAGEPPAATPPEITATWVKPECVVEVRFMEWTGENRLRQPVFVRWRDDKQPRDCTSPAEPAALGIDTEAALSAPTVPEPPRVEITNPDKIFWPDEGYTKGDLVAYYRTVAPLILPYLRNRPVVLTRYPDGITGKSFFQQNVASAPPWLKVANVYSESEEREKRLFVCDDREALLYLANLATIPLHIWSSRLGQLSTPDWCVIDLDPGPATIAEAVTVAKEFHALCQSMALPCYAKTSGQAGLHVLIPLGGQLTHAQCRVLAQLLGQLVAQRLPDIATIERTIRRRGERVYIDTGQNGHGRLLVAPWCVRPVPGATISMPLPWRDINRSLEPKHYALVTVSESLKGEQKDPMAGVLEEKPDIRAALAALEQSL